MPVPKRKTSKARRNKRHANKGLDVSSFTHCANSGAPMMSHTVCLESGYYKGVKVMRTKKDRLEARGQKRQEQEAKMKQAQEAAHAKSEPKAPVEAEATEKK